jgi:hypothetical protein
MTREDKIKWKAKHFGGKYRRVEIRKTAGSQVKIVVSIPGQATGSGRRYIDGERIKADTGHADNVVISMNGPAYFSFAEMQELQQAVEEARERLRSKT